MHAQLNEMPMPSYQIDYLKESYLNETLLGKRLNSEEEIIREQYISGEPILALQSFKKYYNSNHPNRIDNKMYEEFNRLIE